VRHQDIALTRQPLGSQQRHHVRHGALVIGDMFTTGKCTGEDRLDVRQGVERDLAVGVGQDDR
jgi:hypothetical protein